MVKSAYTILGRLGHSYVGAKILGCSFCSKVTTTLSDQVVDLNCEGSATNKNSLSSSPSRHFLIHEFGDLDMPLVRAKLGHVQEHPQEHRQKYPKMTCRAK